MTIKSKIAFFSLTSCEGCQFVLLDLGEKFFEFLQKVELVDFPLIEDKSFAKSKAKIDVAFVEGNPITKENIRLLKKIRKESKILVAMGNCAAFGGIPEIKNYQQKVKVFRYLYKNFKKFISPEIREIDNFVKVDFVIPGCPINGEEFLRFSEKLVKGEIPKIRQSPVCTECPKKGTIDCFLAKKEICFGPITLAGCGAVCPKNNFQCLGCRGFLKTINANNFIKNLEKFKSRKDIKDSLEIFGLRDAIGKK